MELNEYRALFSRLHSSVREEEIVMGQKQKRRTRIKARTAALLLVAALVLILALGAAAVYRHQLEDLFLRGGEQDTTRSESAAPFGYGKGAISLQGWAGSPEYEAALEWAEFEHSYDRDGEIAREADLSQWLDGYTQYNYRVYSQEMADELERIAAKYGLRLHWGGHTSMSIEELEEIYGDFLTVTKYAGVYFEDGTIQVGGCTDDGISFQLRRFMKGTMDTVLREHTDIEEYEQWTYTTACGVTVLMGIGPDEALIFADNAESFVSVWLGVIEGNKSGEPVTREVLEKLADGIDFSLL